MSWVRPKASTTLVRGIFAHAGGADQMGVARFLHHFLGAGRPHHLLRLLFAELDQLLVVLVQVEVDVRDAEGQIGPSLRPASPGYPAHGRISPSRPKEDQWL